MTGYKYKIILKESNEYVTIRIYDREVTWYESVSDSLDTSLRNNGTQIISLISSTFQGVLIPCKHNSILRIKAKFSLAFVQALILLLGSFLLLARRSAVCEKKRLHSLLINP